MKRTLLALGLVFLPAFVGCSVEVVDELSEHQQEIVWGDISAQNYNQSTAQEQEWATATGITMRRSDITYLGAACPNRATGTSFDCSVDLKTYTAQQIVDRGGVPLCAHGTNTNFYPNELEVDAACTAFLVGPDVFATAGHCIFPDGRAPTTFDAQLECSKRTVVMRWRQSDNGEFPNGNPRVLERHIYDCVEVLSHGRNIGGWILPSRSPGLNSDWAFFRVDRAVTGGAGTGGPLTDAREPLPMSTTAVTTGTGSLTTVGHPFGHPTKIDPEVSVFAAPSERGAGTFALHADVQGGMSGGPVIDASGKVRGIVSAAPDTIQQLDPRFPTSNTVRPSCGDGVVTGTEECDEGDTTPGDGCSANCEKEQFCEMECFPPSDMPPNCPVGLFDLHPIAVGAECANRTGGSDTFCSAACPCEAGAGDCDGNAQCGTNLECATDYGPAFRQKPSTDVCVPSGCGGRAIGSGSFCTDGCPCGYGGGDCDPGTANTPRAECMNGLVCATDYGAHFGASATTDVCVTPQCGGRTPGTASFCTALCPCGQGGGDCDVAADCMAGSRCATDIGPAFNRPADYDMCVPSSCTQQIKANLGKAGFCTAACPCGRGGGDCNTNDQCMPGLTCAQNVGAQFGYAATVDVCTN